MTDRPFDIPIVGAPLAGGPSTPALAAAVSDAGGLGFVAAGYRTAGELALDVDEVRTATDRPFGVNIFHPTSPAVDHAVVDGYVARLAAEAERYGVSCGEPRWSDDDWDAKLEVVARVRPAVVSFAFGCPSRDVVGTLQSGGSAVWCTVTSPREATVAHGVGVDALVVQGAEAGGHQSSFDDTEDAPLGLLSLLQVVRRVTDKPLIGTGGIATGRGVAAVLAAGAWAAQIGTALLLTPEAGTSKPQRSALAGDAPTALTRAFTGRRARGIVNRFLREHDAFAPRAYPEIHYATVPIRAAARAAGDPGGINLWAGQAYRLAEAAPAAELIARWAADAERQRGAGPGRRPGPALG
ncbi:MAG: nitronate monooxygenase [Gaiellaceae bacterium]